jgi:hypothetical protein
VVAVDGVKRRKAEGLMQAVTGRRTAIDDWPFDVFGAMWESKVHAAAKSKAQLHMAINEACSFFKVSGIPIPGDLDHHPPPSLPTCRPALLLPDVHNNDSKIAPTYVQLEFIVDNKAIADIINGTAFDASSELEESFKSIETILLSEWVPRMLIFPLIQWRPRSWNTLADLLVNIAMDTQQDSTWTSSSLSNLSMSPGILLQWHADGGARGRQHTAIACALTVLALQSDGSLYREFIYYNSLYLGPGLTAADTERRAINLALNEHQRLNDRFGWRLTGNGTRAGIPQLATLP